MVEKNKSVRARVFFSWGVGGGGGVSDRLVQLQEHCGTKRKRVRVAVIRSLGHK